MLQACAFFKSYFSSDYNFLLDLLRICREQAFFFPSNFFKGLTLKNAQN